MAESDAQTPTSRAAGQSRKLIAVVIALAILPLVLPFLLRLVNAAAIYPLSKERVMQCASFNCMIQTQTDWERLEWLLILGPSFLTAMASIFLGIIGNVRIRRQHLLSKDELWFDLSIAFGAIWLILLGCIYGGIFWIAGVAP